MHSPVKTAVGGARDLLTSPAGVVAFRRTGRTPHGTYRVMRKTLSVAPRLAPRAYRLVLPTPTARPETDPTGLLDRLGAGDAHTTAEALRSDGFVRFDGLVDPATCDALEALARTVDCELMPSPAEGPGVSVVDPGAPRAPKYSVPEAALAADPAAQSLIADASLRAVAADYLGCEPVWSLTAMWWSFPWPGGPSTEIAQLFHEDRDHPAFLKFFLYLTDVDEQHGPHVYVRGSHDEHRRTLRADRRYADDEVARHFGDDDLVTVCGSRGTLFAADTKGLHKGLPPVAGARLVFQLEFSSTLFGAPYQRPSRRRAVAGAGGGTGRPPPHLPAAAAGSALVTTPVTIVLPTLDEREHITDCLDSLLAQDYPAIAEILVVDGGSGDGTRDLAARRGGPVRVVPNPRVTAAAAMNVGIAAASADVIVRADAHTLYAPDFVSRCVEVLETSGADVVGGPMRPVGTTAFGRAVAAVTSSPAGVGPGRFHYADEAEDVDTVYLGTYRREVVTEVGGYDEDELQWAAEDQELNFRLRRNGRRIRLDPSIRSQYFPRQSGRALWKQYFNYGMCKASTLKKHRTLPSWRPLAPAAMVAGAAGLGLVGVLARRPVLAAAPAVAYATSAGIVALRLGDQPGVAPHRALGALSICHWAYGLGFWAGMARILTGRPFDTRPRNGR